MSNWTYKFLFLFVFLVMAVGPVRGQAVRRSADPTRRFTTADVAKLKWIAGTWRGMDGDKPIYERYRIEKRAMVVDSFTDGTLTKIEETGRFELKNGQFGKGSGEQRRVAIVITPIVVQFVPAIGARGNLFRFEKQPDGTWNAVLEWPAFEGRPFRQKIYKMEPWPPKKR